jgi:uncharacterized sodium:solute symporter family permease YidK
MRDVKNGWLLQHIRASGVFMFFIVVYCYIGSSSIIRVKFYRFFFIACYFSILIVVLLILLDLSRGLDYVVVDNCF